jgi:hypothetical protein
MMQDEENRIRAAFQAKDWNETQTADSWQVFKVMAEFVSSFEKLARLARVFPFSDRRAHLKTTGITSLPKRWPLGSHSRGLV